MRGCRVRGPAQTVILGQELRTKASAPFVVSGMARGFVEERIVLAEQKQALEEESTYGVGEICGITEKESWSVLLLRDVGTEAGKLRYLQVYAERADAAEKSETGLAGQPVGQVAEKEQTSGRMPQSDHPDQTEYRIGDVVRVWGEFTQFQPASNPGEFDYASYYRGQKLIWRVFALAVRKVETGEGLSYVLPNGILRVRIWAAARLRAPCRRGRRQYFRSHASGGQKRHVRRNPGSVSEKRNCASAGSERPASVSGQHGGLRTAAKGRGRIWPGGGGGRCGADPLQYSHRGISIRDSCPDHDVVWLSGGLAGAHLRSAVGHGTVCADAFMAQSISDGSGGGTAFVCGHWRNRTGEGAGGMGAVWAEKGAESEKTLLFGAGGEGAQAWEQTLRLTLCMQLVSLPVVLWHFFSYPLYGIFLNLLVVPLTGIIVGSGAGSLLASLFAIRAGTFLTGEAGPCLPGTRFAAGGF